MRRNIVTKHVYRTGCWEKKEARPGAKKTGRKKDRVNGKKTKKGPKKIGMITTKPHAMPNPTRSFT